MLRHVDTVPACSELFTVLEVGSIPGVVVLFLSFLPLEVAESSLCPQHLGLNFLSKRPQVDVFSVEPFSFLLITRRREFPELQVI